MRSVETFKGNCWEGTLTAFSQLFCPVLGKDKGNVGNRQREMKDGFVQ